MSLAELQTVLQAQVDKGGGVSVSEATLTAAGLVPADGFDATLAACLKLGAPLAVTVSGKIPAPAGDQLAFSGTASFLGVEDAPVQIVFTLGGDGKTDGLIVATPAGWTFAASFPMLIGGPFADLPIGQPCLLATTAAQTSFAWQPHQPPLILVKGLNFASLLEMSGPLAILQKLIASLAPADTIVLAGTIDPTGVDPATGCPALSLTGSISQEITADLGFDLSLPQILLASAPDENGRVTYWLSFAATLGVNGAPFSTFQAAIIPDSSNVSLAMLATTNPITPEEIIGLIGGVDFTQHIPAELKDLFSAVGLTSLGAVVDVSAPEVMAVSAGIGTTARWTMGPFTLIGMTLNCTVATPFAPSKTVSVNFTATASIFPDVFNGQFDFEISSGSAGDLTIAANFIGTVALKDLVAGISGGSVTLPDALAGIEFDDFGISFTKTGTGYDWQLYGAAKALFSVSLDTGPVNMTLQAMIASTAGNKSYRLVGGLQIGEEFFEVEVDLDAADVKLVASWTALGAPLEFSDVASAFGWDSLPTVPPSLDLGLTGANLVYDFTAGSLAFGATSKTYGELAFATLPVGQAPSQQRLYVVCLATNQTFSLSNLPLIGADLAAIEDVSVGDLQILITSAPVTGTAAVNAVNALVQQLGAGYPTLPAAGAAGGLLASASLQVGGDTLPLSVALGGSGATAPAPAAARLQADATAPPAVAAHPRAAVQAAAPAGSGAAASGGITWVTVQRSFGPLSINRIGVSYQSSEEALWFELDATLAFGALTLSLVGLGIGSPLTSFAPEFSLQGLGVSYAKPPLEIAGSLVNLAAPGSGLIQFEGGLIVSSGDFTLEAFGYYGQQANFTSMFVFGDFAYPLGGPPAFFVTGGALGFGYNSALRLPTIDEVATFPFVQVLPLSTAPNTTLFGANPTPATVLDVVMNSTPPWVSPGAGSLWFGAGITFTSFELVNSQAMIFVETGDELVVELVGASRAQFPQQNGEGGPLYANIELDLEIRFAPAEGVFSVQALLASSSFLLDPSCVLTGGFAFFVWFGDSPHAGDFVVTLGGYNPGFTPPAHYPTVPIVGFHWAMDSTITISGGAYFALTPAAAMVGGQLNATFQSGNLKAWFDAHADIIVRWKPFWFDANIGITIGASYKIDLLFTSVTISVELGCDLEIWGPPTGGTVTVDWYIISFTIPFGSSQSADEPVKGWSDVEAMLPNASAGSTPNILSVTPTAGLTPSGTAPPTAPTGAAQVGDGPPAAEPWRVRGSRFAFSTATPIPATTAAVGGAHAFNGSRFDVFPLGWKQISSDLTVAITDPATNDVSAAFAVALVRKPVPASLWGAPPQQSNGQQQVPDGAAQLVPDQIAGLDIEVLAPQIGATAGPVDAAAALAAVDLELAAADLPVSGTAQPEGDVPVNSGTAVGSIADPNSGIGSTTATTARAAIFSAVTQLGYAPQTADDPMTAFAAAAGESFAAEPLLVA